MLPRAQECYPIATVSRWHTPCRMGPKLAPALRSSIAWDMQLFEWTPVSTHKILLVGSTVELSC